MDLVFINWQLMSALASLERFGEEDHFFINWRSCRHCLQSEWPLDSRFFKWDTIQVLHLIFSSRYSRAWKSPEHPKLNIQYCSFPMLLTLHLHLWPKISANIGLPSLFLAFSTQLFTVLTPLGVWSLPLFLLAILSAKKIIFKEYYWTDSECV